MVRQNRLSHALLFLEKEGSGALVMALAFAQYIACISSKKNTEVVPGLFDEKPEPLPTVPAELNDACGHCPSCIKAQQFIHPDIHFSFPVITEKSGTPPVSNDYLTEWREFISSNPYGNVYDWLQFLGAENKQGNITAEECNQINHKLSLKAFEGRYKILIMWMPEYLGTSGNKLLKLIEEPPPDTLFIFVSQDDTAILPTILSRTQLIKIPPLSTNAIENAIVKFPDVAPEKAAQIAAMSEGNYREALQLLQHTEHDWERFVREWLNITLKRNNTALVKWIDEMSQLGREKQKQFLRYFVHLLGQAIRMRFIDNDVESTGSLHIPGNEKDFVLRLNNMCAQETLEAMASELNKAIFYVERNAHAKMLFHALTIRLFHIIKDKSLILIS
jgi:DNA polymerase-3 subunit delta'